MKEIEWDDVMVTDGVGWLCRLGCSGSLSGCGIGANT